MDDLGEQIAALHAETQKSRYGFLKAELRTGLTTIAFGDTELEFGNREMAASEVRSAEKTYATILRFLPELDSQQLRAEIEAVLPRLRQAMDALGHKLGLTTT